MASAREALVKHVADPAYAEGEKSDQPTHSQPGRIIDARHGERRPAKTGVHAVDAFRLAQLLSAAPP